MCNVELTILRVAEIEPDCFFSMQFLILNLAGNLISIFYFWFMINRHQYEQAIKQIKEAEEQIRLTKEIIDLYETQENNAKAERLLKLKKNDYIEYIGGTNSKYLTVGKKYRLTSESFNERVAIINDAGKRVVLRPHFFNF
ncbi:coiled-coil domain-containing protein [Aquipluma nitroreducens]|nr:hypothetical protein [Aquipluma nitroreducens]